MKLYLTAENERGKQIKLGGGEHILVSLYHKNTLVKRLKLQSEKDTGDHNWEVIEEIPPTGGYKGKKEKGECSYATEDTNFCEAHQIEH